MDKSVDNSVESVENLSPRLFELDDSPTEIRRVHSLTSIIEARPNWNVSLKWYISTCICGWSSSLYVHPGEAKEAHSQHIFSEIDKLVEGATA